MGISFQGNTPDYLYWVFEIDGRTFLARNNSTQSPLRLNFTDGRFFGTYSISQIIPGAVLVKNSGFDIITGTSQDVDQAGIVKTGIVEWTWAGQKYRNRWTLTEGVELSPAIPEEGVQATYAYDLDIQPPYTPYEGPAGGSVGTGVTSQITIDAASTQIVPSAQLSTAAPEQQYPLPMSVTSASVTSGIATPTAIQAAQTGTMTKDEREALEAATTQIVPSAQLSTAAPEQQSPLPTSTKPVGTGIVSSAVIAQSNKTKEDIEASTAYKTYGYTPPRSATYTTYGYTTPEPPAPSAYTPRGSALVSPVTPKSPIAGTKDAREAAAAAAPGVDWVKLGLQLSAAYLLLS